MCTEYTQNGKYITCRIQVEIIFIKLACAPYILSLVIFFALIGLSISGLICLGLWGSHSTCTNSCDGFEQCEIWCSNSCEDSCNSCFGAICGGTGGFIVGCADCGNCAPSCGMSCAKSCIDGCKKGGCDLGGCENLGFACEECGWSCEACGDGIKKDWQKSRDGCS